MINHKYFKNLSNICLFLSIIIFCYIFYRALIHHSGLLNDYYLKYYIISLSLIFFSLLSYFITNPIKIKITKFLIFFIVFCYIIEAILTFKLINVIDKQKIKLANKIKDNPNFDKRVVWEAYQDLKRQNPKLIYYQSPKVFINEGDLNILPVSGISNTKYFTFEKEHGQYPEYKTDRYGFRNVDSEWDKEAIDFFLIGDSYMQSGSLKSSIGENLRRKLKNNNGILNLAHSSFGTLYEYAFLKEYLPLVKAKRVVLFYFESNDLTNLYDELKNVKLAKYLNDKNYTQNLYLKQDIIDKMYFKKFKTSDDYKYNVYDNNRTLVQQIEDKKKINWYYFLKLYKLRKITIEKKSKKPIKKFENIIKLFKKFSEKNGAKFYFVYVPEINRYLEGHPIQDASKNYKKVIQILENLKIEYIDLHSELFLKADDPLIYFSFESFGHSNELAFKTVAQMIYKKFF